MATLTSSSVLDTLTSHCREGTILRALTPRVARLDARLQERMRRPQRRWTDVTSPLDDPATADLPLVLRKAMAFRATLATMPIAIEGDDLIVGNCLEDGVVVRPIPPQFATEAEIDAAAREGKSIGHSIAHKTPDYAGLMAKGLSGIIGEIQAKLGEIQARPDS